MSNHFIAAIFAIILTFGPITNSLEGGGVFPSKTSYFVFTYTPGPTWLAGKPITAQPLQKHFAYMATLEADKTLVLGGPFKDSSGAMGIIEASTLAEAKEIIAKDPAVKDSVVNAEVKEFHPAVIGCLTRKEW